MQNRRTYKNPGGKESGRGNTRFIAEEISNSFKRHGNNVSLISAEEKEMLGQLNYEDKLVGIGFPCYALNYPDIIAKTVEALPFCTKSVPSFIFSTKGWSAGDSMKKLAALMRKRNYFTIKTGSFTCPNNGWITLFSPNSILCRNMKFEYKLLEKITRYTDDIIGSLDMYEKKQYCVRTTGCLAVMFLSRLLEMMERLVMQKYRVDYDKCAGCGLCIRKCPDHNIEFDENQKVVFINPNKCTWCLRCVSDCPKSAIKLGGLITGKGWYTMDLRKEYQGKINKEHSCNEQ